VETGSGESILLLSRCFSNLSLPMGKEEPGDSQPIISEWGGAWVASGPGKGGLRCP
jgi:hypothetical protein